MTIAATLAPTCEARTGFYPGEFAEMPLFCGARIGLSTWTDTAGLNHRACRHHVAGMQSLYPPLEGCYFCRRTDLIDRGLYIRISFGSGVVNVCDTCAEKGW